MLHLRAVTGAIAVLVPRLRGRGTTPCDAVPLNLQKYGDAISRLQRRQRLGCQRDVRVQQRRIYPRLNKTVVSSMKEDKRYGFIGGLRM